MIRFILVALFLLCFGIVSIPMILIELILRKCAPKAFERSSYAYVYGSLRIISFLSGIRIEQIGRDKVPQDQAVLYVANHRSMFDVVLTYPLLPYGSGYISKKEFKKVPILYQWMYFLNCLFLDRSDLRQGMEVIMKAIDMVKDGHSMFIFPEGTRNKSDDPLLPFHKGSFKIAQRTGAPIVPITIIGTEHIWEEHPWSIHPATVKLIYGDPIYFKDLTKEDQKEIHTYVAKVLEKAYTSV